MARSVSGSVPTTEALAERPSAKQNLNGVSASNHVVVRDDVSGRAEDDAGAQRALDPLAAAAIGKQATLQRGVQAGVGCARRRVWRCRC